MSADLRKFGKSLTDLSVGLGTAVASSSAEKITELGRGTFEAGQDAYGTPWAPGADGKPVDLKETGALEEHLSYKAVGRKIRSALGVAYAKFQIGKRPVYPRGALPPAYVEALKETAQTEIRKALGVSS